MTTRRLVLIHQHQPPNPHTTKKGAQQATQPQAASTHQYLTHHTRSKPCPTMRRSRHTLTKRAAPDTQQHANTPHTHTHTRLPRTRHRLVCRKTVTPLQHHLRTTTQTRHGYVSTRIFQPNTVAVTPTATQPPHPTTVRHKEKSSLERR